MHVSHIPNVKIIILRLMLSLLAQDFNHKMSCRGTRIEREDKKKEEEEEDEQEEEQEEEDDKPTLTTTGSL